MTSNTDYITYDKYHLITVSNNYDISTDISNTLYDNADKMFPNNPEDRSSQKSKVMMNAVIFKRSWIDDVNTQVKHICNMAEKASMDNKFSLTCESPLKYKDLFPVLARVLYQHNIIVEKVKLYPNSTDIPQEMMISFGDNFKVNEL
jgi:hypothetical protein